ncbi:hypothetical protein CRG98_007501, partial [Punica granatum]
MGTSQPTSQNPTAVSTNPHLTHSLCKNPNLSLSGRLTMQATLISPHAAPISHISAYSNRRRPVRLPPRASVAVSPPSEDAAAAGVKLNKYSSRITEPKSQG